MSLGIGIISSDGIILACESRTLDARGGKRFDLPKITKIECDRMYCAVVQAGKTALSSEIVLLLQAAVNEQKPTTSEALRNILNDTAKSVMRHISGFSQPGQFNILEDRFELILAVWDHEPHLYEYSSKSFYAQDRTKDCLVCIGSDLGVALAQFILDGLSPKSITSFAASYAAVYAVEVVKKRDGECEGQAKVMFINHSGCVEIPQRNVDYTSELCRAFEEKNRIDWINQLAGWVLNEAIKAPERWLPESGESKKP
jgi:20S proteasome alpha/beta subunit